MLAYRACTICEVEVDWGNDLWTLNSNLHEAKRIFDENIQTIVNKVLHRSKHTGKYKIIMCFSDRENFRYKVLPTYKANRVNKRKPVGYSGLVSWVKDNYNTILYPTLEADDCLGILATSLDNCVVVSGDKDLKSIPSTLYNFLSDDYSVITEEQADYNHFYQTLIGDTTDNYTGCPKVGAVTAKKLLDTKGSTWETVKEAFIKQGCTEEYALTQARVARILRCSDYDLKKQQVILWTP